MDMKEIENRFVFHPASEEQGQKYAAIRAKELELAKLYVELCPESRELSLALTKLEESGFWGNAAIARHT